MIINHFIHHVSQVIPKISNNTYDMGPFFVCRSWTKPAIKQDAAQKIKRKVVDTCHWMACEPRRCRTAMGMAFARERTLRYNYRICGFLFSVARQRQITVLPFPCSEILTFELFCHITCSGEWRNYVYSSNNLFILLRIHLFLKNS